MKKTLTLFLMLIVGIVSSWAQLPEFSTEDNPVYYKVNFIQGSTFLQDNGSGTFLTNENASANVGQLFAFVGTQNNFKLLSKLGNYVTTKQGTAINNGQSALLLYSSTTGDDFQIMDSPKQNGCFVITRKGNTSTGFNTWGGAAAPHNIGFWENSDPNNQIKFLDPANLPDYSELDKLITKT